jgi:site-specific recombinase XerD
MDNLDFEPNHALLVPAILSGEKRRYKDMQNRLGTFASWLTETGRTWEAPDLLTYRNYLLRERGLAPSTVNTHLSAVRVRYRTLLKDGTIRAALNKQFAAHLSPAQREEEIEYVVRRLRREIDPNATRVEVAPPQMEHLRLTPTQIQQLLDQPNQETLVGIRDTAIFALLVCTGIRENELCALDVVDLYCLFDGQPALHVPPGRGCTERLIPYGGLLWGLERVNAWLEAAEIADGPVFRGFYKGGCRVRQTRLSPRALEYILAGYRLEIEGRTTTIRSMDLRRTYARLLYEAGVNPAAIQTNLGLKDSNAVLDYIGEMQPSQRVPPRFDAFG